MPQPFDSPCVKCCNGQFLSLREGLNKSIPDFQTRIESGT